MGGVGVRVADVVAAAKAAGLIERGHVGIQGAVPMAEPMGQLVKHQAGPVAIAVQAGRPQRLTAVFDDLVLGEMKEVR